MSAEVLKKIDNVEDKIDNNLKLISSNVTTYQQLSDASQNIESITISGFPNVPCDNSELFMIVQAIADVLKFRFNETDIIDAKYLNESNLSRAQDESVETQTEQNHIARSTILVKFANNKLLKSILKQKRTYKKLTFDKLDNNKYNVLNKFKDSQNFTVYVNECLPKYYYKLLKKARTTLKAIGIQRVWNKFCYIYAQANTKSEIHLISCEDDIEVVKRMYDNNSS